MQRLKQRICSSRLAGRMARGAFWSLTGAALSRGLMLAAFIAVARLLGKQQFGELGVIRSTLGMFGVFAGFGLGVTTTKFVAELRRQDPLRAGRIISLSNVTALFAAGVVSVGVFCAAPWLARYSLNAPELSGLLQLGCLVLLLNALNGVQTGTLAGFEAFRTIAAVNLAVGLISFPLLTAGAHLAGLRGAVLALAASLAVHWLLNYLAIRREMLRAGIPRRWQGCRREQSVLWRFTLPALVSHSLVTPVIWMCIAMLVQRPGGYEEMAVYYVASQWYVALLFVPRTLGTIVLPVLSDRLGVGDGPQASQVLGLSMLANAIVVGPLVLVGSLLSPLIMSAYGSEYVRHWLTLFIFFLTAGLVCVQEPIGQLITARGRMWLGCAMNVGWAAVILTATYAMLPWGALGFALAHLIAYSIHAVWSLVYATQEWKSFGDMRLPTGKTQPALEGAA